MIVRQPLDLWGQRGWHGQDVAGESHYSDAIRRVLGGPFTTDWIEVQSDAQLLPEPSNAYDRNAVQVLIGGSVVGYLPKEDSGRYATVLSTLVAEGWLPQVSAEVRGGLVEDYDYDGRGNLRTAHGFRGSVRLDLGEPHLLVPANSAPDRAHVMLPYGNAIQVTGEEAYLQTLAPLVGTAGETWIHVTLHEVSEQSARSTKTLVEVRVDNSPGGRLTPKMSGELLPAIRHFADQQLTTACRAMLKGNQLKSDITLYVARAGQLPQELLSGNPTRHPSTDIGGDVVTAHTSAPAQVSSTPAWRFNPPPGWPEPPAGWAPPPGWVPPPNLPPAPPGWFWWTSAD